MATFEVHDGRGRVEYVSISREHPALIGSDPKCDIVISDPRALPFHGRLRWKGDRFKAEAFPEARSLDLNGKKVVSASFRRGDELQIGDFRIFLMNETDVSVDEAKTQVQRKPGGGSAGANWLQEGDMEAPSAEEPKRGRDLVSKRGAAPSTTKAPRPAAAAAIPSAAKRVSVSPWRRFLRTINAGARPGEEKLLSSPLILGLIVLLGFLSLLGYFLWNIVSTNKANAQFLAASQAFDEHDYRTAIKAYDDFIKTNPGDLRASEAKVRRELANVRQFTSGGSGSWSTAVEAAQQMVEKVKNERKYDDMKMDLAAEIMKSTEGLADQAKGAADAKILADAEAALKFHETVAGPAAKTLREKANIAVKINAAKAAVEKARRRREDIAKMSDAVSKDKADEVFTLRDTLTRIYPDLSTDKEVVKQLEAASDLVRKAVTFDPARRPADSTPHPDPLGPPVSLVLRLIPPSAEAPKPTPDGPLVYAMAQGYLYAIDGTNGAPIWHVPIGLTSPFAPMPIGGGAPALLAFDARYNELVRYEGRTGKLVWRQGVGEAVAAPPLVLGNQAVQVLPSGKILVVALGNGEITGTIDFGRPLAGTPAADEAGQFFYVTADRDVVFVLTRQPPECVSVTYLGHKSGSIRTAPARLADFLIVPQNNELWEGQWNVFLIDKQGEQLRLVQSAPIQGWTWQTPASQGTVLWSLTDRNAISAYAMGSEDAKDPLKMLATTTPDARPSGPAYARARSDRELWISAVRLGRFDLDAATGTLTPSWTIERAGPSIAPIQTAGPLAVFTHQFEGGAGVALWGVDPNNNGRVAWKTVLGSDWPLVPTPSPDGQTLTTLAMDGPEVAFTHELLERGGFLEQPLRRPGYFNLPEGPLKRLERDGLTILVPSPESDHLLVREGKTGAFRRIDLPAPLGALPVFWGADLFVPGLDGRAYLVDPATGATRAEPYVPTFDNNRPTRWLDPAFMGDAVVLVDSGGQVRRLARLTEPRLRLAVVGDPVDLNSEVEVHPAPTTGALVVATADNRVRSLAARDLSSLGAWNLEVPRAVGPLSLDGKHAILVDKGGGVMMFGPNGDRVWVADLGDSPPLAAPILKDDTVWFLSRDGVLQKRSLSDGSPSDRVDLNILPAGGLWNVGRDVIISSGPGTVRLLRGESAAEGGPH